MKTKEKITTNDIILMKRCSMLREILMKNQDEKIIIVIQSNLNQINQMALRMSAFLCFRILTKNHLLFLLWFIYLYIRFL